MTCRRDQRDQRARRTGESDRRVAPVIALLLMLLAGAHLAESAAYVQPGASDPYRAAVAHLERTAVRQRNGSHLTRLLALRQLRDPALTPLFRHLATRADWQVRVHATLALAEIDDAHRLDATLVSAMDARAREVLVANALDLELLPIAQARELSTRDDLDPMSSLLLLAELQKAGEPIDLARLEPHASSTTLRVAALAALIAAQGGEPTLLSACAGRIGALPRRDRDAQVLWMLDAIRQYRLTAARPWVERVHAESDRATEVRRASILTLLLLHPETGFAAWHDALGATPSYGDRVRAGMLLLAAGPEVPVDAWDRVDGTHELPTRMAAAGRALATGADPTAALIALIDLGHLKTASWVMNIVRDLPVDQARRVLLHVLEVVEGDAIGRAERVARAVDAAAILFDVDRAALIARLEQVEDDSLAQEVILLGLFDVHDPAAGAAAAGVRRIGAGRADALALLLTARYDEEVDGERLRRLGLVSAGGGRVSDGLQAQAAWLYLRHSERIPEALALVLPDD